MQELITFHGLDGQAFRRDVLDWRDRAHDNIEVHLYREIGVLFNVIDEVLQEASWKDVLLSMREYGQENLQPLYQQWAVREIEALLVEAENELVAIYSASAPIARPDGDVSAEVGHSGLADVATAGAGAGLGLVAIPVVASLSTTSVTVGGILGFGTATLTTVVSWPVAIAGIAAVSGLLAFGGYKASTLRAELISGYRGSLHNTLENAILGAPSLAAVSLRQQLHDAVDDRARTVIAEVCR